METKYPCGHNPESKEVPDGSNCLYSHLKDVPEFYGVKIIWDEDRDVRVLCWLDSIIPSIRDAIFSVGESKAFLDISLKSRSKLGFVISDRSLHESMILTGIGAVSTTTDLTQFMHVDTGYGGSVCGDFWVVQLSWEEERIPNEYLDYINSQLWKTRSGDFKKENNGYCRLCGVNAGEHGLQTHHIKYPKDFKNDKKENWIAICKVCHRKLHGVTGGL